MTTRKNYNSIFFLTVYFGLVLVGAAPQVLAHAATNSLFDLRNEIEFKDDLDNQPDDSCAELKTKTDDQYNEFFQEYGKQVLEFLKQYPPDLKGEMLNGVGSEDDYKLPAQLDLVKPILLKATKDRFLGQIVFKTDFETKKITSFVLAVNQSLVFQRCQAQNLPEKVIYENTKVSAGNNRILVVTRLPRASIDLLLK